jgi:polysaccharide deacetylase family protein (PEP-CTERM system associated)
MTGEQPLRGLAGPDAKINLLTIDVEDWFHTTALEPYVSMDQWESLTSRLEFNVRLLLDLFAARNIRATFFILGWVAERYPELIKQIDRGGHEIASHGYRHRLIYALSPRTFRDYALRSKNLLEDLTGKPVLGYRATSFSIIQSTLWALDVIKEIGFIYDSSMFPIKHDIYGINGFPRFPFMHRNGLIEIPPSTVRFLGRNFPIAGGGYFRLYPYWLTQKGIQSLNQSGHPAVLYLHPWELDPSCPKIENADRLTKFRQYINLNKTKKRLEKFIEEFKVVSIGEYLRTLKILNI